MKKLGTILLMCWCVVIFAQSHNYFYEYKYVPNLNKKDSVITETMMLNVTKEGSRYESYDVFKRDSILQAELSKQLSIGSTNVNLKSRNKAGSVDWVVTKTYPDYKVHLHQRLGMDNYKIIESDKPVWSIETETQKIGAFTGQKAVTAFAGRKWTAWFSSEIPIPDGPFKLHGLPGLIIKLESEDQTHSMTLVANRAVSETKDDNAEEGMVKSRVMTVLNNQIEVTKDKFKKAYKDYLRDPSKSMKQLMASAGSNMVIKMADQSGRQMDQREFDKLMEKKAKSDHENFNNRIEPDLFK